MPKLSSNFPTIQPIFNLNPNLAIDQLDSSHQISAAIDQSPLEQELNKALFFFAKGKLLPSYTGDFKLERINPNSSPSEVKSLITNLILKQGYHLSRIDSNDQPSKYYLSRGLLGGGRTLNETRALLEESLITKKKIVFISYRWSKETDPQIDNLCYILEQHAIRPLRDRDSFALGDRIDEYMSLIPHLGIDQTIILLDEGYLTSRNCMNEMQLVFRSKELIKGRVIIIPLIPNLHHLLTAKKPELIQYWQEKSDELTKDGNLSEARLARNIAGKIDLFLTTLAVQNNQTLEQIAQNIPLDLIAEINHSPTKALATKTLPFKKSKLYVGRIIEQDNLISNLTPGTVITITGPKAIGKSALVNNSLTNIESDLFRLFPDGIISIEFDGNLTIHDAIIQIASSLNQNPLEYKTLFANKRILLLIDNPENIPSHETLDDLLNPLYSTQSSVIITTTTPNPAKSYQIALKFLTREEQAELLIRQLINYIPLKKHYQQLLLQPTSNSEINQLLLNLNSSPITIAAAAFYLSRSNIPLSRLIDNLNQDPEFLTNNQIRQYHYQKEDHQQISTEDFVESLDEDFAQEMSPTQKLLNQSLTTDQKIVFISHHQNLSSDPRIISLYHVIQANNLQYLKDPKFINHFAIDKIVILVDEDYLKDLEAMSQMSMIFLNQELVKGRVIIIPTIPGLFTAYQTKKGELIRYWQEQHEQYQKDGHQIEAKSCQQIIKRIELFLNTMGMQTTETIETRAKSNFTTLITEINKSLKKTPLTKTLPFIADKIHVGRKDEEEFIASSLLPGKVITITGPAGMGKSALIRNSLSNLEGHIFKLYDQVILLEFNSGIGILQAISKVVLALDPGNDQRNLYLDYQRLVAQKKVLILVDGAEDAMQEQEYNLDHLLDPITKTKSSAIISTRIHDYAKDPDATLALTELNKEEQAQLLLKHLRYYLPLKDLYHQLTPIDVLDSSKNPELSAILNYLGGLPIAIQLAGSYLSNNNLPLKDSLKELEQDSFTGIEYLIKGNIKQIANIADQQERQITINTLLILGNGSYQALSYNRLQSIIADLCPNIDNLPLLTAIDNSLGALQQLGLIKAEENKGFSITHNPIYRYVQDKMALPENIRTIMINNYDHYLKQAASDQQQWPAIDQELVHITEIVKLAIKNQQYQKAVEIIDKLQPEINNQKYLDNNGDYLERLQLLQLRLKAIEEAIKRQTDVVSAANQELTTVNNNNQTRYQPQDIADCYILIGDLENKFANYDQALAYFNKAYDLYLKNLGKKHKGTANSIHSIATVYNYQGQYDKALEQYQIALRIYKAKLGEDHPSVADTINNIASVYYGQGQYDQALEQYQIALRIRKVKLGDDHPDVAIVLNNIGIIYSIQGQYDQATEYLEQALRIRKVKLGDDHSDVATTMLSISAMYKEQGKDQEALSIDQECLRIKKAALGEDHPHVIIIIKGIGGACGQRGKYQEALQYFQEALRIQKAKFGDDHPDVAKTANLARGLEVMIEIETEIDKAKKIVEKISTPEQHQIALQIALRNRKAKLGKDHLDIANTIQSIALTYYDQGKYDQALEQYQIVLRIRKAKLGDDHPDVIATIGFIGALKTEIAKTEKITEEASASKPQTSPSSPVQPQKLRTSKPPCQFKS